MYVIARNEDGAFVAPPGREKSYTKKLQEARVFRTREAAQRDACGNETVHALMEVMQPCEN